MSSNEANTHYNSMQVDLNSQLSHDLFLRALYTLSRAVDPTTAGSGGGDLGGISNPYAGWAYDNGLSGYNRTHVFVADFIYDIPLLRHSENKFLKNVVAGWQFSGIITVESGLPENITLGGTQGGNFVGGTNRPNVTGPITYEHVVNPNKQQQIQYINPSAFSDPAIGAYGDLAHNGVTGPGRDNWNLLLFKSFTLSESRGTASNFASKLSTPGTILSSMASIRASISITTQRRTHLPTIPATTLVNSTLPSTRALCSSAARFTSNHPGRSPPAPLACTASGASFFLPHLFALHSRP